MWRRAHLLRNYVGKEGSDLLSKLQKENTKPSRTFNVESMILDAVKNVARGFTIHTEWGDYMVPKEFMVNLSNKARQHGNQPVLVVNFNVQGLSREVFEKVINVINGDLVDFGSDEADALRDVVKEMGILDLRFFSEQKVLLGYDIHELMSHSNMFGDTMSLIHNGNQQNVPKAMACLSPVLKQAIEAGQTVFTIGEEHPAESWDMLVKYLTFQDVTITRKNMEGLLHLSEYLGLEDFNKRVVCYSAYYEKNQDRFDKLQDASEPAMNLVMILLEMTEESFMSSYEDMKENGWFKDHSRMKEAVANIVMIAHAQGRKMAKVMASYVVFLSKILGDDFFVSYLKDSVLSSLHRSRFLAYELWQQQMLEIGDIIRMLSVNGTDLCTLAKEQKVHRVSRWGAPSPTDDPTRKKREKFTAVLRLFLREVYMAEPEFISYVDHETACDNKENILYISWLGKNTTEMTDEDWDQWMKVREADQNPHPIARAIAADNVEAMQIELAGKRMTDVTIPPCDFDNPTQMSLMDYAVMHGAVNCVKSMIMNGVMPGYGTLNYAIINGSAEMMHILDQVLTRAPEADLSLQYTAYATAMAHAIECHRNEFFHWLLETKCTDEGMFMQHIASLSTKASRSNNFDALITMIDMGIDAKDMVSESVISDLTTRGFGDMLKFVYMLVENPAILEIEVKQEMNPYMAMAGMPMNEKEKKSVPPCVIGAAKRNRDDMLDFIVQHAPSTKSKWNEICNAACETNAIEVLEWMSKMDLPQLKQCATKCITSLGMNSTVATYEFLASICENMSMLSVMEVAATYGNNELAKYLIDKQHAIDAGMSLSSVFSKAILGFNMEIAEYLINQGIVTRVSHCDTEGGFCAANGYLSGLKTVLKVADITQFKRLATTWLVQASAARHTKVVAFLVDYCNANSGILIEITRAGSTELMEMVLKIDAFRAGINHVSSDGTALCIAAQQGSLEMVKLLLSVPGIDPAQYNIANMTPMMIASKRGNLDIIKAIVEFYGDKIAQEVDQVNISLIEAFIPDMKVKREDPKNFQFRPGPRALAFGARAGPGQARPVVQLPVNEYAMVGMLPFSPVNEIDAPGFTYDVVRFFMGLSCIDPNFYHNGQTLLTVAALTNNNILIRELLTMDDIDVSLCDKNGNTALMLCAARGNVDGFKMIFAKDPSAINDSNIYGETPFTLAALSNHVPMMNYITQCDGFDNEKSCVRGALIHAIVFPDQQMRNQILGMDFDINATFPLHSYQQKYIQTNMKWRISYDYEYVTALEAACIVGDAQLIGAITQHARFNQHDDRLKKALFLAVRGGLVVFNAVAHLIQDINLVVDNESLLMCATLFGDDATVQQIIATPGFDPVASKAFHALALAVGKNSVVMFQSLAALPGIDLNEPVPTDINLYTHEEQLFLLPGEPLLSSALSGDIMDQQNDIASELVNNEAVNVNYLMSGQIPVIFNVVGQGIQITRTAGIDINTISLRGNTLLHHICSRRGLNPESINVIEWLVNAGIDITKRNDDGLTAWNLMQKLAGVSQTEQPEDREEFLAKFTEMAAIAARNSPRYM